MAILNSCCCCRSVRRGSYACAIYSMVYYLLLSIALWHFIQAQVDEKKAESVLVAEDQYHHHFSVIKYLGVVMLTLSIAGPLTCVLLIIGLRYDIRTLLLPWLVDAVLIILLDLVFVGYIVYQEYRNMDPVAALTYTFDFFVLVLNIYTVLCVTSQYQEYLDGRGTSQDDGSRSPPTIRYSRQSTMNSGLDSTRRTVTFLEQGILTNGFSPAHNSQISRAPSIINKDNIYNERSSTYNTSSLHPAGPDAVKSSKNNKKHVQFPADTIVESETSDGETCTIITSKDADVTPTLQPTPSSSPYSKDPKKEASLCCLSKDAVKDVQMSCINSSKGPEATPLIKPESPDDVTRY